jgi:type VI secretion system secreted protein Hcp
MRKGLLNLIGALIFGLSTSTFAAPPPKADELITINFDGMLTTALAIEVGAENNINIGSISGGGGAGKPSFTDLSITKLADETSGVLLQKLLTGSHFDDVTITVGNVVIDLKLVLVSELNFSASQCSPQSSNSCNPQEETISLEFGSLTYTVE